MPHKVSRALDALDEPRLTAVSVATSLETYLWVVAKPRGELAEAGNDLTRFVAPIDRDMQQMAIDALPARHSDMLRRVVERADVQLIAKTLHNPRTDDDEPWWWRRWTP